MRSICIAFTTCAMNSELVGFPLLAEIEYSKTSLRTSTFPLVHATSIACLIALSARDGVVLYSLAISGYNTFVMLSNIDGS